MLEIRCPYCGMKCQFDGEKTICPNCGIVTDDSKSKEKKIDYIG